MYAVWPGLCAHGASAFRYAFSYARDVGACALNVRLRMQPTQYVAGSKADQSSGGPTLVIGVVAGLIAVAVAFLGLSGNKEISRASAHTYINCH